LGLLGLLGLFPGAFGPLGLFGGLLGLLGSVGVGLAGCCEFWTRAALSSVAPMRGVVANAPIAIKADDHPILLKFIVISPVSNYRPMQGTPIGRYV
jgi:hypothetical protein